jgi:hypothetical protein
MNYSTAVFLINDAVRAVKGIYEDGKPADIFKTLDPSISKDDLVVVPTDTRHKMTVIKIVETDVDVDFDSTVPMKWVICRVDMKEHADILRMEEKAIAVIKSGEIRKKKEAIRDTVFREQMEQLKTLELATIGDGASAEPKPAV